MMLGQDSGELVAAMRRASGDQQLVLEGAPAPANDAASVLFVKPRSARTELNTPAVARLVEEIDHATREATIASYLNQAGFPTPAVLLSGTTEDELGGAWFLSEQVTGSSVGFTGGRNLVDAVRSPGALWRRPALLADLTVQLHSIDPEPVRRRLREAEVWFDWHRFQWERALKLASPGVDRVILWLEGNRPRESDLVISHGDLHPGNIVVGPSGPQVVDWGIATLAPPARDVACTMFALLTAGSQAHRAIRPMSATIGRTLSLRFLRLYRQRSGRSLSDQQLGWHRVLYSLNRLFWAALQRAPSPAVIEDDQPVRRASGVFGREFPIHTWIIEDVTGIDLNRYPVIELKS